MKNLNEYISESRIGTKEITHYIESWLKSPLDSKEMFVVIGAVVQGVQNAYDYRTDPKYVDDNDTKYNKATEVLEKFINQLK